MSRFTTVETGLDAALLESRFRHDWERIQVEGRILWPDVMCSTSAPPPRSLIACDSEPVDVALELRAKLMKKMGEGV